MALKRIQKSYKRVRTDSIMTEKKMLSLAKKSMAKHVGRIRWWQIQKVYRQYRQLKWSKWESFRQIFEWWWRLCFLSRMCRMRMSINGLERDIADNELYEIKKMFGLDVPLYEIAKALKPFSKRRTR